MHTLNVKLCIVSLKNVQKVGSRENH